MQAAKQIRLSRNARRSAAVRSSRSSKTESIHRKQNSAFRAIEADAGDPDRGSSPGADYYGAMGRKP